MKNLIQKKYKEHSFITSDIDNSECNNFIVCYSFVYHIVFLLLDFFSILFLFEPFRPSKVRVGYYVVMISSAFLFLVAQISLFLFRIKINETHFSVRLYNGKKIFFDCSDIYRISTYKASVNHGGAYRLYLKIFTKMYKSPIIVSPDDKGFRQLVKYLIIKLNTGDIKRFAISDSCKKELMQYANKIIR